MNITKCEKCKKQKPEGLWRYDQASPWLNGSIAGHDIRVSFDLCEKCGKGLAAFAKKFFGMREDKKKV